MNRIFRKLFSRVIISTAALLVPAAIVLPAANAQTVTFAINATRNIRPISRYIYGVNEPIKPGENLTFLRQGGNRWTAYNWVNNASNAGSDWYFHNDNYFEGGNTPGGALIGPIGNATANSAALLATVPIQGYVAADKNGDDVRNTPNYLQTRFRQSVPVKGAPFTLTPSAATPTVYQDEFVNWVVSNYPASQQIGTATPIWFSLDNEPDLWQDTHAAIHPAHVTYAELASKGAAYAAGIKAVAPNALVFGPVSYGFNGFINLQDAPDANGRDFLEFYLAQMNQASAGSGKRLLDVLDLHWYPDATSADGIRVTGAETTPSVVSARLQAPRSLWDPTYREKSWVTDDYLNAPIDLIHRMFGKIANNYPGTKLAFTEYNYGAGQHISGGIAQADVLGIFGREGVFAANQFPLQTDEPFVMGAFKMYRNFDGSNGSFGDTSVDAETSDPAGTSVYASLDSSDPNRMVIVAINKTASTVTSAISLTNASAFDRAATYQLTSASSLPVAAGTMSIATPGQFGYAMPPYSVSTLVLTNSAAVAGPLVAAVLPTSRSVQVGVTATAFATVINTGTAAASGCSLSAGGAIPATFSYQTTDPASNTPTGTINTPVNIGPNGSQSFVFALTPAAAFAPVDVPILARCANTADAPSVVGLNTLLLSASATPVPDIVALAASGTPGTVDLAGPNGAGAFAVATVNVGAAAAIAVSADTGDVPLPVIINVCQTEPSSGQCISPLGPSVTAAIAAGGTPTFGVFVQGAGNVPFDPAHNRVFVRFRDDTGVTRGATSVAIRITGADLRASTE